MSRNRFSDSDVGAIIQRASELKNQDAATPGRLSLEDVEQIAEEMGVSADYVRRAVSERQSEVESGSGLVKRYWALPPLRERVTVDRGKVSQDTWHEITHAARTHFKGPGEISQVGEARYWSKGVSDMGTEISRSEVSATNTEDGAVVEVSTTMPSVTFMLYIFAVLISLVLAVLLQDGSGIAGRMMIINAVLAGMGSIVATRLGIAAWMRSNQRSISGFTHELAALIELEEDTEAEQARVTDAPQLDIDAAVEGFEGEQIPVQQARRRTRRGN
ncbi:MAG: hypothetical protein HKN29_00190 [Rhodothermales bacterium]|nr:hypothetical protein [Rhodothermales bacterium]